MNADIFVGALVTVSCMLSWAVGLLFRRNRKAINVRFAFAALLIAPLLGFICLYGYTLIFQYLALFSEGESGWKPLLLQIFATPIFWIAMTISASLQKQEKNM